MTYRDTVHHQVVSFLTNLQTAAAHRRDLLDAYRKERVASMERYEGAYVFETIGQPARAGRLCEGLLAQGIEVHRLAQETRLSGLLPYWSDVRVDRLLPAGTIIVPLNQAQDALVETILGFDFAR